MSYMKPPMHGERNVNGGPYVERSAFFLSLYNGSLLSRSFLLDFLWGVWGRGGKGED